jgi:exopolysaccharide biosynthesis polyprenyl glycosylphosphotransferase
MYDDRSIELDRVVFLLDIFLSAITFILCFWGRNHFLTEDTIDFYSHLFIIPLLLALLIGFLSYFGAYQGPRYTSIARYAWAILRGMILSIGVLLALLFFLNIQYVSRFVILTFSVVDFFVLLAIRITIKSYFVRSVKSGKHCLRVLIIGTGERAKDIANELKKQADWGIQVIGHLDPDPTRVGQTVNNKPVIGAVADISKCLKEFIVDEVIIAIPRSMLEDAEPIAFACEEEGIKLRFMADIFSLQAARVSLAQIGSLPLLTLEPVAQDRDILFLKRLFDFLVTLSAMPVILPTLAIIALAIKLDSPGPVLFIQQRVGLRKHLFPMYKFRSMHENAEEMLKDIEHLNEAEGPIFKMTNDPRVTRVGKFIRKTSLDELPQLINVLKGDMSLVGPRPMSIRDVDLFEKGIQRKRFSVKPGITCIWQISGRSDLPFDKWLELDLQYIDNWSFWLDLKILFKTIPAVLKSKGAV